MTVSVTELADRFTWIDYTVFGLMLGVSAVIGIFYGCFGKKQDTKDFLVAGKSMTTFPVAMSLIASFMSAITLLGTPSEVYQFGFIYWLIIFSYMLVMPAAAYLYFPVFHELQVISAFEYLEKRFHRAVRWLGSLVFIIQMTLYMAIVVYAPALALAQVTGFDVYISVSLICFVCIFYTTLGGMKAVLWTDALQTVIMYGSIIFIIIKGTLDVGGFSAVWARNAESGRTQLIDFDPDPTTRHTFWSLVIGGYFTWISIYGVNQAQVQRYLCVQTRQMAVNTLWINLVGLVILMVTCSFGGMVVYAKYYHCDPVRAGVVTKEDQVFPLFVMDTLGQWKGLPGLFVAGIFAGALSTVSSGMNSLAAIVLEDFVKNGCYPGISDKACTSVSRGLSLFFGLLTFALVFVTEQLGNILSVTISTALKAEESTEQYSRRDNTSDLKSTTIVMGSLDLKILVIHPIIFLADAIFACLCSRNVRPSDIIRRLGSFIPLMGSSSPATSTAVSKVGGLCALFHQLRGHSRNSQFLRRRWNQ
ncbi:sodium-coupled monocarboxylate transporter 1-like [Procambarus clarkii]|uniref:sodium-coupled monocarboxylate transporter 1-like n=1 Tax=Procambarus clarkii TaxID=6728 RepID=UPI0037423F8C